MIQDIYDMEVTRPPKSDMYPLPPDYLELDEEAQRIARVNACRLQETPEDLVQAWSFFRSWYFRQLPPGKWYKRYKPSPAMHYDLIHAVSRS